MKEKVLRIVASLLAFAVLMSYSITAQVGGVKAGSDKGVKKVTITNV